MNWPNAHNALTLYYDGECPLCSHTAKAVRIRKSIGELELINARSNDSRIEKIIQQGYDLNEGIVIEFNGKTYFKEDALHLIATLSTPITIFNRFSEFIFRRKLLAQIFYPVLKRIRQFFLWWSGTNPIKNNNQPPIFKSIFGDNWVKLPAVFQKHYANRPYCDDKVISQGAMNITVACLLRPLWSLFTHLGILIRPEKNIPVTVKFLSEKNSRFFIFHRDFHHKTKRSQLFITRLLALKNNEVLDIMRFGFAWRLKYNFEENKIKLLHCGYAWYFLGITIPLPISLLIGRGYGEEIPLSDDEFLLVLKLQHPLFGKIIEYSGHFKIVALTQTL